MSVVRRRVARKVCRREVGLGGDFARAIFGTEFVVGLFSRRTTSVVWKGGWLVAR